MIASPAPVSAPLAPGIAAMWNGCLADIGASVAEEFAVEAAAWEPISVSRPAYATAAFVVFTKYP